MVIVTFAGRRLIANNKVAIVDQYCVLLVTYDSYLCQRGTDAGMTVKEHKAS